jgi:hypothetical protein
LEGGWLSFIGVVADEDASREPGNYKGLKDRLIT